MKTDIKNIVYIDETPIVIFLDENCDRAALIHFRPNDKENFRKIFLFVTGYWHTINESFAICHTELHMDLIYGNNDYSLSVPHGQYIIIKNRETEEFFAITNNEASFFQLEQDLKKLNFEILSCQKCTRIKDSKHCTPQIKLVNNKIKVYPLAAI